MGSVTKVPKNEVVPVRRTVLDSVTANAGYWVDFDDLALSAWRGSDLFCRGFGFHGLGRTGRVSGGCGRSVGEAATDLIREIGHDATGDTAAARACLRQS